MKKTKNLDLGQKLNEENINSLILSELFKIEMKMKKMEAFSKLKDQFNSAKDIQERFDDKVLKIQQGDDLLPSVGENGKSIRCNQKKT